MFRLVIAARTFGTNDVAYFEQFAEGVRRFGPVMIYGHQFDAQYNHGPLTGWILQLFNLLVPHGVYFPLLMRIPASLADLVTAYLIFKLVGRLRGLADGVWAAMAVAWSPALIVISGFHGNTDPVFVMLCLLCLYLLTVRPMPLWAGVAIGMAVSIKVVPIVLLPYFIYIAVRRGTRAFWRFGFGGLVVFLGLWLPVIWLRWSEFRDNVLLYQGVPVRQWGISELLDLLGLHRGTDFWVGPGRFLVVGMAALAPFIVLWRTRDSQIPAMAFAFAVLLVASPAFGMQYLSWTLAPAYLVSGRLANWLNAASSVFVLVVYCYWNHAPPWDWDVAKARPFTTFGELACMTLVWLALVVGVVGGFWRLSRRDGVTS